MDDIHSDALVFFGAPGDLAYKKIFPALHAMVKHGHLNVPVVGVAKSDWNLDNLRARAKDSIERHGGIDPRCGDCRFTSGIGVEPHFLLLAGRNYLRKEKLSSRRQFRQRGSRSQNDLCQGTEPLRSERPSETLLLPPGRRRDRSCPRLPARVALNCEDIPETSGRVLRSKHNRETDPAEYLCFPDAPATPYPGCTIPARPSGYSRRRAYTATEFLRTSEHFAG